MKLGLGTVQFGTNYGISNTQGKTPDSEVLSILQEAKKCGVSVIDTAHQYGVAEETLGNSQIAGMSFKVVTKTPPSQGSEISSTDIANLENAFRISLSRLKLNSVYAVMMHNADDLLKAGGEKIWDQYQSWKSANLVQKIGISVYEVRQIDEVLKRFPIDIIQVPLNVFDQRLLLSGHLKALKKSGVEVHARSAFLQGLLLMNPENITGKLEIATEPLKKLNQAAIERKISVLELALQFSMQVKEVDSVICGVNNLAHFKELAELANRKTSLGDLTNLSVSDKLILSPNLWK